MKHWRRELADGGIEFFMEADDGTSCQGTVAPASVVDGIQAMFEDATGCQLPEAEIRRPRYEVGA